MLEWAKGSTLRPVLAALDAEQAAAFLAEYGERVRLAYQPRYVRDTVPLPPGVHGGAPARGPQPQLIRQFQLSY